MDTWELTEYELQREPQKITLDSEIVISPPAFYREILCPVCQEILKDTRAAPECLHRFCKKCVEKVCRKECPVCHKKLPAQAKSFRPDIRFDRTIALICNGYQEQQTDAATTANQAPMIEIVLKQLNGQKTRYLKLPEDSTVEHITRFLAMKSSEFLRHPPDLTNNEQYKLCIVANISIGRYEMLTGNMTLEEIKRSYQLPLDRPLELYFYKPSEQSREFSINN